MEATTDTRFPACAPPRVVRFARVAAHAVGRWSVSDRSCLLVGISGPICAGKTTTARFLERQGFAYSRFSLVIDDEVTKRGLPLDRQSRQAVGWDIHERCGQAWLAERVLLRVASSDRVVIDGLRFREDHDFFVRRFGSAFLHAHVIADREVRRARYEAGEHSPISLLEAEAAEVEAGVAGLVHLATAKISNNGSREGLFRTVAALVEPQVHGGDECRSPLS